MEVAALKTVRQLLVVEAQAVQRGVQILNEDWILRRVVAVVVGRGVNKASVPRKSSFLGTRGRPKPDSIPDLNAVREAKRVGPLAPNMNA